MKIFFRKIKWYLMICFFSACAKKTATTVTVNEKPDKYAGYIPVMVKDYKKLDGCEFLLIRENGEKLQPVNLPDSLKRDGINIRILFKPENKAGICMAGKMILLTDVIK
jgi:hypothetical protein